MSVKIPILAHQHLGAFSQKSRAGESAVFRLGIECLQLGLVKRGVSLDDAASTQNVWHFQQNGTLAQFVAHLRVSNQFFNRALFRQALSVIQKEFQCLAAVGPDLIVLVCGAEHPFKVWKMRTPSAVLNFVHNGDIMFQYVFGPRFAGLNPVRHLVDLPGGAKGNILFRVGQNHDAITFHQLVVTALDRGHFKALFFEAFHDLFVKLPSKAVPSLRFQKVEG